jgi:hypothetical protein
MVLTYAAVAPNISARLAFVNKPTLAANRTVKMPISPSFKSGDLTLYKTTIAPISRRAAKMVLKNVMKPLMRSPDAYANRGTADATWRTFGSYKSS